MAANVTETKEVFTALFAIVKKARDVGKDGWQVRDGALIINDDGLRKVITDALMGSERIMVEMSKLNIFDTMDLATYVLSEFPRAMGAK